MRYYVLILKILSTGTEERSFTPYDNYNTAYRKFHEAFNTVGGGPKLIAVRLLGPKLTPLKDEVWEESAVVETEQEA